MPQKLKGRTLDKLSQETTSSTNILKESHLTFPEPLMPFKGKMENSKERSMALKELLVRQAKRWTPSLELSTRTWIWRWRPILKSIEHKAPRSIELTKILRVSKLKLTNLGKLRSNKMLRSTAWDQEIVTWVLGLTASMEILDRPRGQTKFKESRSTNLDLMMKIC